MSSSKKLKDLPISKGCRLRIFRNDDEPDDSLDKYRAEASYDGKPDSELFFVPPHWHKYHDEYILVTEGRVSVTIDGITRVVSAGDEAAHIPRWHVHSLTGFKGEKMTLLEQAVPAGPVKALFFNDLLSKGPNPSIPHILRVMYDGDMYPSLPGNIKLIDQLFVLVVCGITKLLLFWDRKPMQL